MRVLYSQPRKGGPQNRRFARRTSSASTRLTSSISGHMSCKQASRPRRCEFGRHRYAAEAIGLSCSSYCDLNITFESKLINLQAESEEYEDASSELMLLDDDSVRMLL